MFFIIIYINLLSAKVSYAGNAENENLETGYRAIISDDIDLINESDYAEILEAMDPVTEYGNAMLYVAELGVKKPLLSGLYKQAENIYDEKFGLSTNGMLLMIDMDSRELVLRTFGEFMEEIPDKSVDNILSKSYKLASSGDYTGCIIKVFDLSEKTLKKVFIPHTTTWLCNGLVSALMALLITFKLANKNVGYPPPEKSIRAHGVRGKIKAKASDKKLVEKIRVVNVGGYGYNGSLFGGGGGGGGFSGGGGGRSSGGGHHSF